MYEDGYWREIFPLEPEVPTSRFVQRIRAATAMRHFDGLWLANLPSKDGGQPTRVGEADSHADSPSTGRDRWWRPPVLRLLRWVILPKSPVRGRQRARFHVPLFARTSSGRSPPPVLPGPQQAGPPPRAQQLAALPQHLPTQHPQQQHKMRWDVFMDPNTSMYAEEDWTRPPVQRIPLAMHSCMAADGDGRVLPTRSVCNSSGPYEAEERLWEAKAPRGTWTPPDGFIMMG
eukprot:jgi/Mesvir1/970/Mv17520-RA.1